jgi:anthranilate phosphoribosyltransferase
VSDLGEDGQVRERVVTPEEFGLERVARSVIAGSDPETNARALTAILDGDKHPARGAVVLNAAAALAIAGSDDLRACAERARNAIDSGAARATLDRWRRVAARERDA